MEVNGALIFLTIIVAASAQFHQDSYDIIHDRIEILKYNKSAVRRPDFKVIKYNDTVPMKALNASGIFMQTLHRTMKMDVTVFRLVGNTYRVFPINVTLDGCDSNKVNLFGLLSLLKHTNFRGCPAEPGYYYLKYYLIEQDKFPPHLPFGKYKLFMDIHINDGTVFIGNGNWYGSIVPKSKN